MILTDKLSNIANAIRRKTGKSEEMTLDEMPVEIEGIFGNKVEKPFDCHSVTFVYGDKSYVRSVADGDICADPVERGLIPTPTKESTAQYNYTFYGWGASDGGAANANILKNITEDKTVYAIFTVTVKTYTITYLDSDGTALKTEVLPYGATPSYTPAKDGYSFVAWIPEVSPVVGDSTYTASWEEFDNSLLPRQAITFNAMDYSKFGTQARAFPLCNAASDPSLVNGKTYIVEWEGVEYTCVARDISYPPYATVPDDGCIGNSGLISKIAGTSVTPSVPATGEPFLIWPSAHPKLCCVTRNAGTYTVRIREA